jgi:hypothetical protein
MGRGSNETDELGDIGESNIVLHARGRMSKTAFKKTRPRWVGLEGDWMGGETAWFGAKTTVNGLVEQL